jgi:hypothetical protein
MSQGNGDVSQFFGGQAFDPNSVEPAEDFAVLPAGDYPVLIEATDVKQTKKKDGHYFEFQFLIMDGPAKGRKLWDRMNINNPSEKAVAIAQRSLSALVNATIGAVPFNNTDQLLNKACIAVVKVKDGENSIRTYKPLPGMPIPTPAQLQQQLPPSTQPPQQQAPPVVQGTHGIGAMQPPLVNQQAPPVYAPAIVQHPQHTQQQMPMQQQPQRMTPPDYIQPTQQQPPQQPTQSNPVGSEPWS